MKMSLHDLPLLMESSLPGGDAGVGDAGLYMVTFWPRIFSSTLLILIIPRVDGDSDSGGFHDAQSEW